MSGDLKPLKDGDFEIARLTSLPASIILYAKVAFLSGAREDPTLTEQLTHTDLKLIETYLLVDSWLVDKAWCNLIDRPSRGATTVSLHGTVNLASLLAKSTPDTGRARTSATESLEINHTASLRVRLAYDLSSYEFEDVWLSAVSLDSLEHSGDLPMRL